MIKSISKKLESSSTVPDHCNDGGQSSSSVSVSIRFSGLCLCKLAKKRGMVNKYEKICQHLCTPQAVPSLHERKDKTSFSRRAQYITLARSWNLDLTSIRPETGSVMIPVQSLWLAYGKDLNAKVTLELKTCAIKKKMINYFTLSHKTFKPDSGRN